MKKLLKVFNSLEEIIAGSLFGVMCITILCQMFSRIFLKKYPAFVIYGLYSCVFPWEKRNLNISMSRYFFRLSREYQTSSSGHLQVCSALEFTFTCCTGLFSSLIFRKW